MDSLPRETLDIILEQLLVYNHPVTERFATITDESKKDVLNARLVCRGFCESKSMQDAFCRLLEEIPLFHEDLRLERFESVSKSRYADNMATLTFPGSLVSYWSDEQLYIFRLKLRKLIYYFPHVYNLRIGYEGFGEAENGSLWIDTNEELSLITQWAEGLIFDLLLQFQTSDLGIRSVELLLQGLGAWSCSIPPHCDLSGLKMLTRLSVNLIIAKHTPILDWRLQECQNLEFLEIALGNTTDPSWDGYHMRQHLVEDGEGSEGLLLPKLKTLRLTADMDWYFHHSDVLHALKMFPNLQCLGLAYFPLSLPEDKTLQSFIQELQAFKIASIQLIFPSVWNYVSARRFFQNNVDYSEAISEDELGDGLVVKNFADGLRMVPLYCRAQWLNETWNFGDIEPVLGFSVFDK
ncbi:uncharacterized protein N0V89_005295 [Didymosphaeria variabile]|uniref:Uncharacterized protein n=1 Tax=Didymosphaeria variabile TaxID=1932322 RepID=A0A9W8XMW8_9PLEO|nr:uncharacterized protein N0V89_005295 [Didymosphaeria variabile]KAJ4353565.1 hypothetical protein N0V89_005295 [Didymosphaeria variabile]